MIAFLALIYVALLAILVKLKILPNAPGTWLSTVVWIVLLFVVLFIPMQWGAPAGSARVMTYSVQIIPNVNGVVTEVPVLPNVPLKKGDVLFKLDPTTFQAAVDAKRAQLSFQTLRLQQYRQLASRDAGTRFQVDQAEAEVDMLRAELQTAEWNLDETTVRAPSDGYVTFVALRPGQRVTSFPFQPAMVFIDTSTKRVVAQVNQIYLRHVRVGQPVEIAFKTLPGQVVTGKVDAIVEVASQGQAVIGGTVPVAQQLKAEPFFVRIAFDDSELLGELPPGAVGTAAIYTQSVAPTHVIRKVMIRMESIMNYVKPGL
jgi:RND family efflux transporter MFP subunit